MFSRIGTRAIAALLIVSIIVPSALLSYPQKAAAQDASCLARFGAMFGANTIIGAIMDVPVNVGTAVKSGAAASFVTDCVLKPLAVQLAKAMLYNITVSTVNWINSGFQGNPGFVQDFRGLLTDTADQMIGEFIAKDLGAGFLCSPFSFQIKIALAQSYLPYKQRSACTFTQIAGNVGGFVEGNNSGGWDNWLQVTTVPQNNAYGSFVLAQDALSQKIFNAQAAKEKYLDWGRGFRDWEVCETQEQADKNRGGGFDFDAPDADQTYRPAPVCEKRTPGAVVQDRLSATLNIDLQQLAVADNINAIMDALANQVTKQIVTGAQGLLGSKNRGGGYGSVNYSSALANSGANDPGLTNAINNGLDSSANAVSAQLGQGETEVETQGIDTVENPRAEIVTVQKTDLIRGTNSFRMQLTLQTNFDATGLTIVTTLKRNGVAVPLSEIFLKVDASGGGEGRWVPVNTNVSSPSVTWLRAASTLANPYSFVMSGARRPNYGAGTYTLETVVTDRTGNQLLPLRTDELVVQ